MSEEYDLMTCRDGVLGQFQDSCIIRRLRVAIARRTMQTTYRPRDRASTTISAMES